MATFKITDGTNQVNFVDSSNFQVRELPRGVVRGLNEDRIAMEIVLKLNPQADHDAAASDLQALSKMLNRVGRFADQKGQQKPVYIEQQTDSETNSRKAQIVDVIEMPDPDLLDYIFKKHSALIDYPIVVIRERAWRGTAPGVLPSPMTLGPTDGPDNSPTEVFVTNHQDDAAISHIFEEDVSAGTFSSNLAGDATGFDLFNEHNANTPAAGDAIYFGADDPHFCNVLDLATAFDGTATFLVKYYNGSSFVDIGTKLLTHPEASIQDCLKTEGKVAFSWGELSDWATTAVNGETKYWIKLEIDTVTTWTTTPAQDAVAIYNQSKNYVEIPATSFSGDMPPIVLTRVRPFHGGDENAGFRNISRIIMGVNSDTDETNRLDKFVTYIPLGGNGHTADFSITNLTDASSVSDPEAPGGQHCAVDFGTDTTMEPRVRADGTGLLPYYKGEFRVFFHMQQVGGAEGDTRVRLKTYINGTAATDPHVFLPTVGIKSRSADLGPDLITPDGLLRIPFSDVIGGDTLPAVDVSFEIQAEQISSGAELELYGLVLMPVQEGSTSPDDPVTDNENGSSALRGGTAFDIDPGVIAFRAQKHLIHTDGSLFPVENWPLRLRPPEFENIDERTRVYFLVQSYTAENGWGFSPQIGTIGQALHVQLYPHWTWSALRGAD